MTLIGVVFDGFTWHRLCSVNIKAIDTESIRRRFWRCVLPMGVVGGSRQPGPGGYLALVALPALVALDLVALPAIRTLQEMWN